MHLRLITEHSTMQQAKKLFFQKTLNPTRNQQALYIIGCLQSHDFYDARGVAGGQQIILFINSLSQTQSSYV